MCSAYSFYNCTSFGDIFRVNGNQIRSAASRPVCSVLPTVQGTGTRDCNREGMLRGTASDPEREELVDTRCSADIDTGTGG